MADKIIE